MALVYSNYVSIQASIREAAEETAVANQSILINAIWPKFGEFLTSQEAMEQTAQTPTPEAFEVAELIRELTANTKILKVKIYSSSGRTVFSTDFSQIGKEYGNAPGFQAAIKGKVRSDLSFREFYQGIHGTFREIEVMGTYLPVFTLNTGSTIVGVTEIYIDVSSIANHPLQTFGFYFSSGFTLVALFGVFVILVVVVARLERRLTREHEKRVQMTAELTRVEHLNKAKSQFLAQIGHELRTPLNAILGFAETIRDQVFGPDQAERYSNYAGDIHRAGKHLLGLVNDILDLDRLETGRMTAKLEHCDIAEIMDEVGAVLGGLAADRRVTLDFDRDMRPLFAWTDRLKTTQILLNIISNAIKFTPEGGWIYLRLVADEQSGGILFECRDNGIGMTAEEVDTVMSSVGRTDSALTAKGGGVGLGLPITRQLVELLGGRFQLKSRKGSGTTVTVLFRDNESNQARTAA